MTGSDLTEEARRWIGVPWKMRGRDRDGVDCVGLLAMVGDALQIPHTDDVTYGNFFDTKHLLEVLLLHAVEVPRAEAQTGDVFMMAVRGEQQHTAFYDKERNTIIHATALYRKVVEHTFNDEWRAMVRKTLRVKGLA